MKAPIRTTVALVLLAATLGACTGLDAEFSFAGLEEGASARSMYAAMPEERFPIPAIAPESISNRYLRQVVSFRTKENPGTVVVDTPNKFLYLVLKDGKAMRYGVGVGRQGYSWAGRARVGAKRRWPTWTPPAEMIERQPELKKYRNGQPPSLDNPLGARALYIFKGDRDTLYRLHGTNEYWTIGQSMSSGCIRLFNQDIIDLYDRVQVGATVVVIPDPGTIIASGESAKSVFPDLTDFVEQVLQLSP